VYNQLLGIKMRKVSLWVAPVYLDTESLWQRKRSYTRTLGASLINTLMRKVAFYILFGISLIGIYNSIGGILDTMVSIKYETQDIGDCISGISGKNLCLFLNLYKGLLILSILILILLIIFRSFFLKNRIKN
jgi:hypothetical protein